MTKVYIIEEYTWDHHRVVAVFASYDKAEDYCDSNYGPRQLGHDRWKTRSFSYYIDEYDVQE